MRIPHCFLLSDKPWFSLFLASSCRPVCIVWLFKPLVLSSAGSMSVARRCCLHGGPRHLLPYRAAILLTALLGFCLVCFAAHLFKKNFFFLARLRLLIWPHSKPKRATSVSVQIICQPCSTAWGGYLHMIQLWLWKSSIGELSPREKTGSSLRLTLWAVDLVHFHPYF